MENFESGNNTEQSFSPEQRKQAEQYLGGKTVEVIDQEYREAYKKQFGREPQDLKIESPSETSGDVAGIGAGNEIPEQRELTEQKSDAEIEPVPYGFVPSRRLSLEEIEKMMAGQGEQVQAQIDLEENLWKSVNSGEDFDWKKLAALQEKADPEAVARERQPATQEDLVRAAEELNGVQRSEAPAPMEQPAGGPGEAGVREQFLAAAERYAAGQSAERSDGAGVREQFLAAAEKLNSTADETEAAIKEIEMMKQPAGEVAPAEQSAETDAMEQSVGETESAGEAEVMAGEVERVSERDAALSNESAEALKAAKDEGYKQAQQEIAEALRDPYTGETRNLDDAIDAYDRGIEQLQNELKTLPRSLMREAQKDLAAMQRKHDLLVSLKERGENPISAAGEAGPGEVVDVAEQAAGGELGDNNPLVEGERDEKNILADPEQMVNWAEAKHLHDQMGDSDMTLKGVFLRERQELEDGGMTREAAEQWIAKNRDLSAEEIAKLSEGVDDKNIEQYISQGYYALRKSQIAANDVALRPDVKTMGEGLEAVARYTAEIQKLEESMINQRANLEGLQRLLGGMADDNPERERVKDALEHQQKRVDELQARINAARAARFGASSAAQDLPEDVREVQYYDYEYSKGADAGAEKLAAQMDGMVEKQEPEKLTLREKIANAFRNNNFLRSFKRRTAAAALAILIGLGLGGKATANETAEADIPEGEGLEDTATDVDRDVLGDMGVETTAGISLTADQEQSAGEQDVDRARTVSETGEFAVERETNEYGVKSNYDGYFNYAAKYYGGRIHEQAFWENQEDVYENEQLAVDRLFKLAKSQPEALASYASNFPDLLEACGLPRDITGKQIDAAFNQEGGGELQDKLLKEFKSLLESSDTKVSFGLASGVVATQYIQRNEGESRNPVDNILENTEATRNGEKQMIVEHTVTNLDGTKTVYGMFLNLACGFQPNVFKETPQPAPSGTPTVVRIETPDETPEPVLPPEEEYHEEEPEPVLPPEEHHEEEPEPELPPEEAEQPTPEPELPPEPEPELPSEQPETPPETPSEQPETPPETPETPPEQPETPPETPPEQPETPPETPETPPETPETPPEDSETPPETPAPKNPDSLEDKADLSTGENGGTVTETPDLDTVDDETQKEHGWQETDRGEIPGGNKGAVDNDAIMSDPNKTPEEQEEIKNQVNEAEDKANKIENDGPINGDKFEDYLEWILDGGGRDSTSNTAGFGGGQNDNSAAGGYAGVSYTNNTGEQDNA